MAKKSTLLEAAKRSQNGILVPVIDGVILSENQYHKDNDRAPNVNSPSQVGGCLRARYYARTGVPSSEVIDPRLQRIWDNGTGFHIRVQQRYFARALEYNLGELLLEEAPLINQRYNIQGHCDGMFRLKSGEVVVPELKSIKSEDFAFLTRGGPQEHHIMQGSVYVFVLQERQRELNKRYSSMHQFECCAVERMREYTARYEYVADGRRFKREDKIKYEVNRCLAVDEILFSLDKPVERTIILYENKNTQEMLEFPVKLSDSVIQPILQDYRRLNIAVLEQRIPPRDKRASSKSCDCCRYCGYGLECWI